MKLTIRMQEDILLVVSMILIAYGFWDRTRLLLIGGGALCIFIILVMGGENGRTETSP